MKTKRATLIFVMSLLILASQPLAPADPPPAAGGLQHLLEANSQAPVLPELALHSPTEWAATPAGIKLLETVKQDAEPRPIPELTYSLYRLYKKTGDRGSYDRPFHLIRGILSDEVMAAWLKQDFSRLDYINDLIWGICEETTWVGPAHERPEDWYIDLFAAETAADLSYVVMLIGDQLPEEVRERIYKEVDRRILTPYLAHAEEYGWSRGRNNWTGVCAGAVGEAFLLLEKDTARQAKAIEYILPQFERFIDIAFEPDGGCLEGIGYWNYGLYHYVCLAEMLRIRTGGQVDLLAGEKIKAIAQYPLAVVIGDKTYASFSDAREASTVRPFLAARLAERTGSQGLLALAGSPGGHIGAALRDLTWWDGQEVKMPPLDDAVLPHSGVARLVDRTGEHVVVVAAKAGHNEEPHNHNDIGSFVVAVDGTVYLCDPGAGLYDKSYFSSKRYENIFANSYGHSVPRIGGNLQSPGKKYCGTMEKGEGKSVSIRFEKAYKAPTMTHARRDIQTRNGQIVLQDKFEFEGTPSEIEEAFMSWNEVEVDGNIALIKTDKGQLKIVADSGTFSKEQLDQACKENKKSGILTRISLIAQTNEPGFTMTFLPK